MLKNWSRAFSYIDCKMLHFFSVLFLYTRNVYLNIGQAMAYRWSGSLKSFTPSVFFSIFSVSCLFLNRAQQTYWHLQILFLSLVLVCRICILFIYSNSANSSKPLNEISTNKKKIYTGPEFIELFVPGSNLKASLPPLETRPGLAQKPFLGRVFRRNNALGGRNKA